MKAFFRKWVFWFFLLLFASNGNVIAENFKKRKTRNVLVILFLFAFFIYLGVATIQHIREYNESLVEVRVTLPGIVEKREFIVLPAIAEYADDAPGLKATAVLNASEYYGEFRFKAGDRAKVRTQDGRSIPYSFVATVSDSVGTRITLGFRDDEVRAGDAVEIVLDAVLTRVALNAVPFEALHSKDNRYYFYEVVKRNGIWGHEYVVRETAPVLKKVESGYAYFRGYAAKAPIVMESGAELFDGMRVKFEFEEDK